MLRAEALEQPTGLPSDAGPARIEQDAAVAGKPAEPGRRHFTVRVLQSNVGAPD